MQNREGVSKTEITPENIEQFKDYILNGALLIRDERYGEAIKHFNNRDELGKIGWQLHPGTSVYLRKNPEPAEYPDLIYWVARRSHAGKGSITLSEIGITVENSEAQLPREIQEETSLVYLEEWLHALQEITGKFLVLNDSKDEGVEKEIDVALFMQKLGIKLTENFLSRYDRGDIIKNL